MSGQKKLSRRDFLKTTGVAAAGLAAAPALKADKRFLQPFNVRQPVKIVYWLGAQLPEDQIEFRREFIDSFNAAHAGEIEVELTYVESMQVVQTALAAGEGPDLWDLPGPAWVMEYTNAGHTYPLDEFAEQFGWQDKLMPWAIEVAKVGGVMRCAPLTYQTQLTDYNKTLFEEKGWTVPTNRADFEAWADDALAQGVFPWAVSSNGWQGLNQHCVPVYLQNYAGAYRFWQALRNDEVKLNDPTFLEAMNLLNDHLDRGYFMGSREAYLDYGVEAAYQTRYQGRGGFLFQGSWMFQGWFDEWEAAGYDWDWAIFPSFGEGVPYPQFNLGVSNTNCINAACQNPEAAATVLDWYFPTDEEGRKRAARIINIFNFGDFLVPMTFAREDFAEDTPEILINFFLALTGALDSGKFGFTSWTFLPAQAHAWIGERFDLVVANEMSVQEFLDGLQETYAAELEQGLGINAPEPVVPEAM